MALFMILAEYALIDFTGVVTLSVAGMFKEIMTIMFAVIVFHDRFTLLNGVGLLLSLIGVGGYHLLKRSKKE